MTEKTTVQYGSSHLFQVKGVLSALHIGSTKATLLDNLLSTMNDVSNSAVNQTAETYRALASDTYLYEQDDHQTHVFVALIGGTMVYGMFELADKLTNGDALRAVVSRSGDLLYVHSVIRSADHLMLLPYGIHAGEQALLRTSLREASLVTIAVSLLATAGFSGLLYNDKMDAKKFVLLGIILLVILPAMSWFGTSPYLINAGGEYAQAIFAVYGFPRPERFDALPGMAVFAGSSSSFRAINAQNALAKHAARYNLTL